MTRFRQKVHSIAAGRRPPKRHPEKGAEEGYTEVVQWIPFREAARRQGIPEDVLRRKILLDEIEAQPVDDDRQYLVAVPSPAGRGRWMALLPFLPLLILAYLGGCVGVLRMNYFCTECGRSRRTEELFLVGARFTITEEVQTTELSQWLREREPRNCPHEWMFTMGGGGPYA